MDLSNVVIIAKNQEEAKKVMCYLDFLQEDFKMEEHEVWEHEGKIYHNIFTFIIKE